MIELTPQQRRELRAQAHVLHPVVSVGQHGLTPHVMHEIDVALRAHGLIKVRVFSDDRGQRETMFARIADELDAAPVQHLGKVLILWRPPEEVENRIEPTRRPAKKPGKVRGTGAVTRLSKDRNAREPRELDKVGRRMRGAASPDDPRTVADSRRRRGATTTKRLSRGGDDGQASGMRRRRHPAGTTDSPPGKRPPREPAFSARKAKPPPEALRRSSSRPSSARAPTGKSAPSPRRRRRVG